MVKLPGGTFYGVERARRRVAGLLLTETGYRPGESLPRHHHERAYFCLVLRGGFTERTDRRSRECGPATVIFHPPGANHADRFGQRGSRCFNVELEVPWLARLTEDLGEIPDASLVFRRNRANWLAQHLYAEFLADTPATPLAIEGLALALLADVAHFDVHSPRSAPRWLDRVVEMLHAAPVASVRLGEIAAEVGIHPVHLARVFRRRYGCSIGEYARRLNLERAASALRDTRLPIGRLAYRLGYADHSHFSRSFRRATGLSPSEYRARHGSDH